MSPWVPVRTLTSACSGRHLALLGAAAEAGVRLRENGEAVDAIHERDRRKPEQHEAR
jgi:hypothetical protein